MAEPVGGMPRVDRAVSAALLLAYVGLKLNDRISLFSFAAKPQALTPAYMHTQDFPALQRAASLIDYAHVESNFTLALTTLSAQLNRRSLIILFTEFTDRSEEHTSELQSLMRISYAVFCLKKKKTPIHTT